MKKILITLGVAALASTASAQDTYLIGGVSFEQLIINGYAATDTNDPFLIGSVDGLYTDTTVQGDYSYVVGAAATWNPRLNVYWDGSNGSSVWNQESEFGSAGGLGGWRVDTVVGEAIETTRRLPGGDRVGADFDSQTGALANLPLFDQQSLGMTVLNGNVVSFVLDATGYDLNTIQLAGGMQNGATAGSIAWTYQTGSGSGALFNTAFSDVFTGFNFDVSSLGLGNELITVFATISGSNGQLMALDSVGFIGTAAELVAVPEPSAYAAVLGLLVAGLGFSRRRRQTV